MDLVNITNLFTNILHKFFTFNRVKENQVKNNLSGLSQNSYGMVSSNNEVNQYIHFSQVNRLQ